MRSSWRPAGDSVWGEADFFGTDSVRVLLALMVMNYSLDCSDAVVRRLRGPALACRGPVATTLVAGWEGQRKAVLLELFAHELEALILLERDRSVVRFALLFTRRILDVSLHQLLGHFVDGDKCPGVFGVVVHEDVVALLRIFPKVEDLGNRCDILLRAFPAEVAVDRESAGGLAVIAADIEDRLEPSGTNG